MTRSTPQMVVVGFGRMGARCVHLFRQGFRAAVVSRSATAEQVAQAGAQRATDEEAALASADFVFLAVPVDALGPWIECCNRLTPEHCIVIDCCTARLAAEQALRALRRPRCSLPELHPDELPVVGECPPDIAACLQRQGHRLRTTTNEDLDEDTAAGIAHFIGMAVDLMFPDADKKRLSGAKSGRHLLSLVEHLKTNSASTYRETQLHNPFMRAARAQLIERLEALRRELDEGTFRFEPYPRDQWRH